LIKNAKIIQYFVVSQCGHFEWLARERLLFNRLAILILLYSGIIGYDSLYIKTLDTVIGIFGGLFQSTSIIHSFNPFISDMGAMELLLTAFLELPTYLSALSIYTDSYIERYKNKLIYKTEQSVVVEYPFIIFFSHPIRSDPIRSDPTASERASERAGVILFLLFDSPLLYLEDNI
jgi:hypothetical protein